MARVAHLSAMNSCCVRLRPGVEVAAAAFEVEDGAVGAAKTEAAWAKMATAIAGVKCILMVYEL
jgi:hypothetical protein